jgi:hypothetical protein
MTLAGCGGELADFVRARAEATCAWEARCELLEGAGFADEEECVAAIVKASGQVGLDRGSCGALDDEAAAACVDAWAAAGCEAPVDNEVCLDVCTGS